MSLFLHRSIFVRLLLIYSGTFLILIGGLILIFSERHLHGDLLRRNIRHYSSLLADEIGSPPDPRIAMKLHENLGLDIAISGPDLLWASRPSFLDRIVELRVGDRSFRRLWPASFMRGRGIARIERPPYTFYVSGAQTAEEYSFLPILYALPFIALVLLGSYALVRRSLKPLRAMETVARAFGQGQWSSRIPVQGKDELSALAHTINEMADRIVGYIDSMRTLLISISHELRSPLTRMKVALEFVQDDRIRTSLNEDITLLDRMTESLLERERLREKPDSLRLSEVVWNEFLKNLASAYPDLQLILPEREIHGRIDQDRMRIAVRNLVENAFKHSEGGPVSLRLKGDGGAIIEVEDSGPGIAEEYWPQLGEPFFTIDQARGHRGFGLGLSLVYAIVKAHGGRVDVARSERDGMIFRIVL